MGYYTAGDYYMAGPVPLLTGAVAASRGALARWGPNLARALGIGAVAGGVSEVVETAGQAADAVGGMFGGGRRRRRMNPLNPYALRRSMRRVEAFARFSRKTISFTKRVKMKKRGRR